MGSANTGGTGRTDAGQATNFGTTGGGGAHSHSYSGSVFVPVSLSMSGTTSSAGSGNAFTTISPYLGMYFIIKT